MKCINCFHVKTHVTNSRPHSKPSVWRRRTCPKCQTTFTTYERPSLDEQPILVHDGQTMPFNIGRLTISIARSFQHNLHAARYDSLRLAETVEAKLLTSGTSLSADDIAVTWTQQNQDELRAAQTERVQVVTAQIAKNPKSVDLYSKRADAYFFLGEFDKALADLQAAVASLKLGFEIKGVAIRDGQLPTPVQHAIKATER